MGLMVMDPLVVPLAYAENPIEVDRNAPQHRQAQVGQADKRYYISQYCWTYGRWCISQ